MSRPRRLRSFRLRTRTALAALALVLVGPAPALAQVADAPTEYRVELLIVEPQNPDSDAWPVNEPVRYEQHFDPRMAAELIRNLDFVWRWIDALGPSVPRPSAPRIGLLPPIGDEREPDPILVERPWAFIALDTLPPALADARERIEQTGEFTAIAAMAWLQPAGSSRRPRAMRVHDDVVILREPLETEGAGDAGDDRPALDTGAGRDTPLSARFTDLDPAAAANADRPGADKQKTDDGTDRRAPTRFGAERIKPADRLRPVARAAVRLDGSIALIRRQFLHADLDLHWRSPVQRPPALSRSGTRGEPAESSESPRFEVHRLQQSRAVRTDRWEFFDSARFGVLLRVTELEPLLPLPPPEPAVPETTPASGPEVGPDAAEETPQTGVSRPGGRADPPNPAAAGTGRER